MNIHKMKYKDLRKQMTKFMKTIYGKITFILAYSVPIILTMLMLVVHFSIKGITHLFVLYFCYSIIVLMMFTILVSFVLGTIYYYHELKEFIKETH